MFCHIEGKVLWLEPKCFTTLFCFKASSPQTIPTHFVSIWKSHWEKNSRFLMTCGQETILENTTIRLFCGLSVVNPMVSLREPLPWLLKDWYWPGPFQELQMKGLGNREDEQMCTAGDLLTAVYENIIPLSRQQSIMEQNIQTYPPAPITWHRRFMCSWDWPYLYLPSCYQASSIAHHSFPVEIKENCNKYSHTA